MNRENMEEVKQHFPTNQTIYDPEEQERQQRARINNNARYMRAQNQVYTNLNSTDRLIAYSLNMNCQSIASVKQHQIQSLLTAFKAQEQSTKTQGQQAFKHIIQNRFQQAEGNNVVQQDAQELEYDDEEEDNDEDNSDEDGDATMGDQGNNQQQQQNSSSSQGSWSDQSDNAGVGNESDEML